MLTCDGPKVIEFNLRFGDPEAQVVLPGLDAELAPILAAAAEGSSLSTPIGLRPEKHVGVVLASEGYPASGPVGRSIEGLDAAGRLADVFVFHAGTKTQTASAGSAIVTSGGRVLTVVGRGATFEQAIARAYDGVSHNRVRGHALQARHRTEGAAARRHSQELTRPGPARLSFSPCRKSPS